MPEATRYCLAARALLSPRARLYSAVPLSSQLPSITTFKPLLGLRMEDRDASELFAPVPSSYLSKSKWMSLTSFWSVEMSSGSFWTASAFGAAGAGAAGAAF